MLAKELLPGDVFQFRGTSYTVMTRVHLELPFIKPGTLGFVVTKAGKKGDEPYLCELPAGYRVLVTSEKPDDLAWGTWD